MSCFIAYLKRFIGNNLLTQFHFSKAERQHFFFLLLVVSFDQRMNEEHIFKGAPGQDQATALAAFLKKRSKLLRN